MDIKYNLDIETLQRHSRVTLACSKVRGHRAMRRRFTSSFLFGILNTATFFFFEEEKKKITWTLTWFQNSKDVKTKLEEKVNKHEICEVQNPSDTMAISSLQSEGQISHDNTVALASV